jgi:arylsulfatase A-like enzyme
MLALGKTSILKKTTSRQPNILWIMTDQQPISTLGCYGNALNPAPATDTLAEQGFLFKNFNVAAMPCSPSRASFFTSLYRHQHGVAANNVMLDKSIPTMGTIFSNAGYDTAYFGKCHLGGYIYRGDNEKNCTYKNGWYLELIKKPDRFTVRKLEGGIGDDQPQLGFKEWAGGWKQYHQYLRSVGLEHLIGNPPKVGGHRVAQNDPEGKHMYSKLPEEHHVEAFIRKRSVEFLKKRRNNNKPFCMVVSFFAPHLPVAPPKPWDTKYSIDQVTLPSNHEDDLKDKPQSQTKFKKQHHHHNWNKNQYLDYIRRYYGYCAYVDFQVDKILKALDKTSQTNDTIVVYTSDHGDMVAAHGLIYKLHSGYDELLRVPFILRYPRLKKKGFSINNMVSSIDALPTLLDLAGLTAPKNIAGRSFRSLLDGRKTNFRNFLVCSLTSNSFAVYNKEYKYIFASGDATGDILYDLKNDPGELHNLFSNPKYKKQLRKMQTLLTQWLNNTKHPYKDKFIKAMTKS